MTQSPLFSCATLEDARKTMAWAKAEAEQLDALLRDLGSTRAARIRREIGSLDLFLQGLQSVRPTLKKDTEHSRACPYRAALDLPCVSCAEYSLDELRAMGGGSAGLLCGKPYGAVLGVSLSCHLWADHKGRCGDGCQVVHSPAQRIEYDFVRRDDERLGKSRRRADRDADGHDLQVDDVVEVVTVGAGQNIGLQARLDSFRDPPGWIELRWNEHPSGGARHWICRASHVRFFHRPSEAKAGLIGPRTDVTKQGGPIPTGEDGAGAAHYGEPTSRPRSGEKRGGSPGAECPKCLRINEEVPGSLAYAAWRDQHGMQCDAEEEPDELRSRFTPPVPEGQWQVAVVGIEADGDVKTIFSSGFQHFEFASAEEGDAAGRERCVWFAEQFRTAMRNLGAPAELTPTRAAPVKDVWGIGDVVVSKHDPWECGKIEKIQMRDGRSWLHVKTLSGTEQGFAEHFKRYLEADAHAQPVPPSPSFEEAWAATGSQYGEDALECVRVGWDLHAAESAGRSFDEVWEGIGYQYGSVPLAQARRGWQLYEEVKPLRAFALDKKPSETFAQRVQTFLRKFPLGTVFSLYRVFVTSPGDKRIVQLDMYEIAPNESVEEVCSDIVRRAERDNKRRPNPDASYRLEVRGSRDCVEWTVKEMEYARLLDVLSCKAAM